MLESRPGRGALLGAPRDGLMPGATAVPQIAVSWQVALMNRETKMRGTPLPSTSAKSSVDQAGSKGPPHAGFGEVTDVMPGRAVAEHDHQACDSGAPYRRQTASELEVNWTISANPSALTSAICTIEFPSPAGSVAVEVTGLTPIYGSAPGSG